MRRPIIAGGLATGIVLLGSLATRIAVAQPTWRSYNPTGCMNVTNLSSTPPCSGAASCPASVLGPVSGNAWVLGSIVNTGSDYYHYMVCPIVNDSAVAAFTQESAEVNGWANNNPYNQSLGPLSFASCRAYSTSAGGVCSAWHTVPSYAYNALYNVGWQVGTEWSSGLWSDNYFIEVYWTGENNGAVQYNNQIFSYVTSENP